MLHRLGGIRTQPEAARRQQLRQSGRCEVGTRRAGAAGRAVILRPVRPPPDGELLGPSTGTARLSMRSPEPDAWAAPLLHLRRPARQRRDRPRASARRRADGDRSGGRGRTEVHGNPQRTTTYRRTRAAAGAIRSLARGTRYAACDPDNRLIAAQLEKSWETALRRVEACQARLEAARSPDLRVVPPDFAGLADDLGAAWNAPGVTMRTRQQLLRSLV